MDVAEASIQIVNLLALLAMGHGVADDPLQTTGSLWRKARFAVSASAGAGGCRPMSANLARVPEYAGTHHETLRGDGYPRRLSAEQLSVPARIMAIADIFEALTAADRPYKKAKTLSEAVRILAGFRDRGHIDPDLFALFLTSGVYRIYGERFLHPEQIDTVDITPFLHRPQAA